MSSRAHDARLGALLLALLLALPLAADADCGAFPRQAAFDVSVVERAAAPLGASLISRANGSSHFNFSFTSAWFSSEGIDGLVVRNVECNPDHHSCAGVAHPGWSNAGALAVVCAHRSTSGAARSPPSASQPQTCRG